MTVAGRAGSRSVVAQPEPARRQPPSHVVDDVIARQLERVGDEGATERGHVIVGGRRRRRRRRKLFRKKLTEVFRFGLFEKRLVQYSCGILKIRI